MAIQPRCKTALPARKTIWLDDRTWASRREYQRFLGTYVLDRKSGFYFEQDTADEQRALIAGGLKRVPRPLCRLARAYELTFSTCPRATAAGHSSTFYANFSQKDRARISPHVEMSAHSLEPASLLPHLTHELSHLWWRHQPAERRSAYTAFLVRTCVSGGREVTEYAQVHLDAHREALAMPDSHMHADYYRERTLKEWSEESFCETVALLAVGAHPGLNRRTNVDLDERRKAVTLLAGLPLPNRN